MLYSGHDAVIFSSHIIHVAIVEGNNNHSQRIDADDSSCEDDFSLYYSKDVFLATNLGCDSFTLPFCFLPSKLYYSIWLPPDIC